MSKDFLNKSDTESNQWISTNLCHSMKISSRPCALFTSSDLNIFDISSNLKLIECNIDCVKTCWLVGRTLSFKGVHCSTKNLLNIFTFVFISVTNVLFIKEMKLMGIFCYYKKISLRKKCPYSQLFWSAFFRILTEYGKIRSISPYFVRMPENTNQNNSEYGHFLRSV